MKLSGLNEHIKDNSGNAFGLEAGLKPGISVRITDRAWFAAGLGFIAKVWIKCQSMCADSVFTVKFKTCVQTDKPPFA